MGKTIKHSQSLSNDGMKFAYNDYINLAIKQKRKIPFDVLNKLSSKFKRMKIKLMNSRETLEYSKIKIKRLINEYDYDNKILLFLNQFFKNKDIINKHKKEFVLFLNKDIISLIKRKYTQNNEKIN